MPFYTFVLQFFLAGSSMAFTFAATITNIDTERWSKKISTMSTVWSARKPSSDEMRRTQLFEFGAVGQLFTHVICVPDPFAFVYNQKLQGYAEKLKEATQGLPIVIRNVILITFVNIANPYLNASEGRRLCWNIGVLNAVVWAAWQIPRLQGFMRLRFTHNPLSGLSYTLLTSVFR